MAPDLFRATREANPFQPFIIHLADGRSYPVAHRDFCIQGPAGHRAIWVFREDGSSSLIDLNLVTELEISALPATPAEPPAPAANGG
jgi:hypothetical protein